MTDKETVKKNFSKNAVYYDRYAYAQNHSAAQLVGKVNLSKVEDILDIGCGTGNYTQLLMDKFPDSKIKAVDISPGMIKVAEKKLKSEKIEFITADAESINLKEKFDLISSNASFQWFNDLEGALVKYKKLLKRPGVILFSIFGPRTYHELNISLKELFRKDISIDSCSFFNKEKLTAVLKRCFRDISIEEDIFQEKCSSVLQLLNKIKYTGTRGNGIEGNGLWTAGRISDLERIYRKKYGNVITTYQIFYCRGMK